MTDHPRTRKFANRHDRRKMWITGSRAAIFDEVKGLDNSCGYSAHFSISSESDSSATDIHLSVNNGSDHNIHALGCPIWNHSELALNIANCLSASPSR